MKRSTIQLLAFLCLPIITFAQSNSFKRHEIKVALGYSSSSEVMFEPLYSFMFSENIGIAAGATLLAEQFGYPIFSKESNPTKWAIDEKEIANHILLRSNMVFRFPVFKQQEEDILFLTLEPGFFINPITKDRIEISYTNNNIVDPKRYQSIWTEKKLWLYYNMRASVSIDLDKFRLGLGYSITNYDIYDNIRTAKIGNETLSDYMRNKRLTHFLEANISYRF